MDEVAGLLLQMNEINSNEARHAYAAMLLIPGYVPFIFILF